MHNPLCTTKRHTTAPLATISPLQTEQGTRKTYRNEPIRHSPLVLQPRFPILLTTLRLIPHRAMDNHASEEKRVEPRVRALETRDQAPANGKVGVARVMDLAGFAVYTSHLC